MKLSYDIPLQIHLGPEPLSVLKVKHGVTEATLSNGQIVRLSIHLESVKLNQNNALDVSYQVVTEVMAEPEFPVMGVHERLQ